ncbi:hypothetical protein [Mycoplasma todarodis]|uniref:Uncharacterized protein n=1 Tax=Mycoplasma todarodis TaxID=1937191 RepID=A0A4R0XT74_9MOLU|nr:hypothetical protein [Mycoplasma todarodis]TCG11670.1 hypothetical protein C4B25_00985 [Mycoplasma todarodis]
MELNKKLKKKTLLSLGAIAIVSTPLITVMSCGKNTGNSSKRGVREDENNTSSNNSNGLDTDNVSLKRIEEDLSKVNRKISRELKRPKGSSKWITKLEKQNFKKFYADRDFVYNPNAVFQKSPRTIINGSPIIQGFIDDDSTIQLPNKYRGTIDTNNLNPELFGMTNLESFVKSNNGKLILSVIKGTEDDSTGTIGIKATMSFNNNKEVVEAEYLVDGFAITKDIEMDGNKFTSISSIINALNEKTHLDFEKKVAIMTPQDLKNELIDLYNRTYGGRLTIIGTYNGKTSAVALDRNTMLNDLINAFGDVSKTKRYDGTWIQLGLSIATHPGEVKVGKLVDLFKEYSNDLPRNEDKDDVAGLLGNLPAGVMNMFPSLLKLFSQVANGVKTMPMVSDWAKNTPDNTTISESNPKGNTYEEKIKDLNHILVRWVLKTGNWK